MKEISVYSILGRDVLARIFRAFGEKRFFMFVKEMRENDVSYYIHVYLL